MNSSSQQLTIPVNTIPTHIVVWQDGSAKGSTSENNGYLLQKVEELTKTVSQLMERLARIELEQKVSYKIPSMEPLSLPPNKSSSAYYNSFVNSPILSGVKTPIAPRSPFFPPMVSPEPVGMSVRPRETVAQIFDSLIKPVSLTLPDVKYNLNEYNDTDSDTDSDSESQELKVNIVKVEEEVIEEVANIPEVVKAVLAEAEEEVVEEEEIVEEEEVVEEEEEKKKENEEEKENTKEEEQEEVEEEVEEEEEEEAVELTEFEYKGKTYYRDQDNQVYVQDEDGDLDDTPIGVWNPEKNKILKYA